MFRSLCALLVTALAVLSAQQPARRDVSLIITGGAVVTMDGGGRVLRPGAVAVDGRDIVGVDTPEAHRAPVCGARDHRRDGAGRHARAHQYAHARADGALPGAGRRPGADGLAAEIHLSGGSQDRQSGVRPGRHAAGGARDDPVGDHGLRRHVLFRGRDRQGHQRSRHPRRPGADHHPVSGAGREDTGRGDCARHDVHPAVVWRRADRSGHRAALDVYARHRHAEGDPGGGRRASGRRSSFTWPRRATRSRSRATSTNPRRRRSWSRLASGASARSRRTAST